MKIKKILLIFLSKTFISKYLQQLRLLDTPILLNILPRIQFGNMPKTNKVKKKATKAKTKAPNKTKAKAISKSKETNKGPVKI